MSRLRVIICRVEEGEEEKTQEVARFDLPAIETKQLSRERGLDELERIALQSGQQVMRRLMEAEWEGVDEQVLKEYVQTFSPSGDQVGWESGVESSNAHGVGGVKAAASGKFGQRGA